MTIHKFGWRRDFPDARDFQYSPPHALISALPSEVDLRENMPEVYDQLALSSCTAQSAASLLHFLEKKQGKPQVFTPSRLAIYYNTRILEGTVNYDSGASIRNSIKSIIRYGYFDEKLWPYDITKFKRKPNQKVAQAALKNKIHQYEALAPEINTLKSCLAEGYPFTFGFSVYESFEYDVVAKTGVMPMPAKNEAILGGHGVSCCGFRDKDERFLIRNSWGPSWGMGGYFTMPYEFMMDPKYSGDFWMIKMVP